MSSRTGRVELPARCSGARWRPSGPRRACKAACILTPLSLLAVSLTGGCIGNPGQVRPACLRLKDKPLVVAVRWGAPKGFVRRTYGHTSLGVGVREPDGLSLGVGKPQYLWCRHSSQSEVESWIRNAELLYREMRVFDRRPEQAGETLLIDFPTEAQGDIPGLLESRARYAEVDDLTPAGLEAARNLSCLVGAAFGERARNAILEPTPDLAARVGFPDICADSRTEAKRIKGGRP